MCGNSVKVMHVGGGNLVCCNVPMQKQAEPSKAVGSSQNTADRHVILGIHITDRVKHAANVQHVLTDFGSGIKTRLGLHEVHGEACSPNGLMLIEFAGGDRQCDDMLARLAAVEGVEVKRMVFDHP